MNTFKRSLMILTVASLTLAMVDPAMARGGCHRGWHPRRNEVMRRDGRMDGRINRDRGHLGGNYKSLMSQDKSIRQQTRADFKANGGYLTRKQKGQLNQEENGLRKDVRQDYTK